MMGANPAEWNRGSMGRYHKEQVDVNGFNAYGYQTTWRNDSYLRNIENLRSASHDQYVQLRGEPDSPVLNGILRVPDFINSV